MEEQGEKKPVWIACRATPDCPGNQALLIAKRSNAPVGAMGAFNASQGGSTTRYRCLTCKGTFQITT
jgi:hypothetical protein